MDYKELLYRCKANPGWFSSNEQKENESRLKYRTWVSEQDEEYMRNIKAKPDTLNIKGQKT